MLPAFPCEHIENTRVSRFVCVVGIFLFLLKHVMDDTRNDWDGAAHSAFRLNGVLRFSALGESFFLSCAAHIEGVLVVC